MTRSKRALLGVFALTLLLQAALHWRSTLYDTDSHLHLAVGGLYAAEGVPKNLEMARFSVMREGFGDKEWLFHAFLGVLTLFFEPLVAGRVALALLNGLIAVVIAWLALPAIGRWGLVLPFALPILSTEFFWRTVRLRPELFALPLFLCALAFLAERRPRLLGLVMLLLTWSYTAFHAFLGVLILGWLVTEIAGRERALDAGGPAPKVAWPLAVYPVLGAGLGLVLHPHFPHNLLIWMIQNVQFFIAKGSLDAGTEILPNTTDVTLMANLGLWLTLLVVWFFASRSTEESVGAASFDETLHRRVLVLRVSSIVFGLLYLLMSRFSLYAVPLFTLWALTEARFRGYTLRPGRLPVVGTRLRPSWMLALCVLIAVPGAARQLRTYLERTDPGPENARVKEWHALSAAIPEGARVAADWRSTGTLALWAPQGRYLNVLDPVFMEQPNPVAHRALREVLAGTEPDVPSTVRGVLDSEYLLVRTVGAEERLLARLNNDPRVEIAFRGSYLLARFVSDDSRFLGGGWQGTNGTMAAPDRESRQASNPTAYISGDGFLFDGPCMTLQNRVEQAAGQALQLELAPRGQTSVWIDGAFEAGLAPGVDAVLGRGLLLALDAPLATTNRQIMVQTCAPSSGGAPGFYLAVG